ncbi:MAG: hypothetical protein K2M86_06850 [Odoribacter sp.]|nr:hypothetical protein [Odoribacter sp.]
MADFARKHLQDILNAIHDIETFFDGQPKQFENFCQDLRLQRAVERCIIINHLPVLEKDVKYLLRED